jgi:hypothetical protein
MGGLPKCVAAFAVALCVLAACASGEWRYARSGPGIAALASVKRLGIAVCPPRREAFGHALRRTSGALCDPVEVEGVSRRVAVLAPNAAARGPRAAESLAAACRRICAQEIGSSRPFDYAVACGVIPVRILGQWPGGAVLPCGYDTVKIIDEWLDGMTASSEQLRDLGSRAGIDALLVLRPAICAELGMIVDQASEDPYGMDVQPGSWLLMTAASWRYALFDTGTGCLLAGSAGGTHDQPATEEVRIIDMGPKSISRVTAFMGTDSCEALFEEALRDALKPLLPLFRCCVIATR